MLWFWVFVSVFSLIGWAGNFVTLDGQRRRLQKSLAIAEDEVAHQTRKRTEIDDQVRRDIREQVIKRGELQNALKEKVAQVENLEKTVEAIMAQIGNRDGSIKALNVTLAKRDTELRDLRDAVTRRNAEIEGLWKEIAESRKASQRLTERINGAERELSAAKADAARLMEGHTFWRNRAEDLAVHLDAAKALLEGVKVGESELLIVQSQGNTQEMLALKAACGDMPGKLVVLDNLNAWKATPIGSHAVDVDPSEFIDAESNRLSVELDRARSQREAIAVELDVKTRELAKIMRSWQQHWKSFPIKSVTLGPEHEARAQRNHGGQSLARLNERGGLCPSEAVSVVEDRDWYECTPEHALAVLGPIRADQEGG